MTRTAVRSGFERFVDDALAATAEEFDVGRALGDAGGTLGEMLSAQSELVRRAVVEPKLDDYRGDVLAQFDAVLDYAESDEGVEAFRERLLARDIYADSLREELPAERRREVEDAFVSRCEALGDAVRPLVDSEREEFWAAVRDVFDEPAAAEIVEERFRFTEPVRSFPDAFRFDATVDPGALFDGALGGLFGGVSPIRVEFTDEVSRAVRRGERRVVEETLAEVRRRYADG